MDLDKITGYWDRFPHGFFRDNGFIRLLSNRPLEYTCNRCNSRFGLIGRSYVLSMALLFATLVAFLLFFEFFAVGRMNLDLLGLLGIFIPFVAFYLLCTYLAWRFIAKSYPLDQGKC